MYIHTNPSWQSRSSSCVLLEMWNARYMPQHSPHVISLRGLHILTGLLTRVLLAYPFLPHGYYWKCGTYKMCPRFAITERSPTFNRFIQKNPPCLYRFFFHGYWWKWGNLRIMQQVSLHVISLKYIPLLTCLFRWTLFVTLDEPSM